MPFNKAKGRMFRSVGHTWTPIGGCSHACKYCYAASLSKRWGRSFVPHFREHFMKDKFPNDGTWIFVGSMGDTFCQGVKDEWIHKILAKIYKTDADNKFLLQTKNPHSFLAFYLELEKIKDKIILGTTLETNRGTPWSKAPPAWNRYDSLYAMKKSGFKTFLSLEPLADFDLNYMTIWIKDIAPEAIEIGLENYTTHLPRPPMAKVNNLIRFIEKNGIDYKLKEGLSRPSSPTRTLATRTKTE